MSLVASFKLSAWNFVVTTQCMAVLTACGNGLTFGHGAYSKNSAFDSSHSSGNSSDATWTQAMLQEEKRYCDRTGHRPARIIFALAHTLSSGQLADATTSSAGAISRSQDELMTKRSATQLEAELTALQKSLDQIQRINNSAKSAAPNWPGIEVQFRPFRLFRSASDDQIPSSESGQSEPRSVPADFGIGNSILRRNLNETSTAPLLDTLLKPLVHSIESTQNNYTAVLQSAAAGNTNNPELSRPLSEANTIMIVLVARSTSEPDPEELENAKRLFGAKRFFVVTVESPQNTATRLESVSPSFTVQLSKIAVGALACGGIY